MDSSPGGKNHAFISLPPLTKTQQQDANYTHVGSQDCKGKNKKVPVGDYITSMCALFYATFIRLPSRMNLTI